MARSLIPLATVLSAMLIPLVACSSASDSPSGVQGTDDSGDAGADVFSSDATSDNDTGTIPGTITDPKVEMILTGCPQAGYAAQFSVGGVLPYTLVVDTGSAELAVAGDDCGECADAGIAPRYRPGAKSVDEHQTTSVSYVSGSGWSGEIYQDQFGADEFVLAPTRLVDIQNVTGGFFTNNGCAFGSIPFTYQGIAGFGPSALAKPGTDEPMAAMAANGYTNIFALALCGLGGEMWVGWYDSSKTAGAPKYTPLLTNAYYAIKVSGVTVGTTSLGLSATDIDDVVVDTDTTEFELPSAAYDAARDAIAGSASFQQYFGGAAFFDNGSCIQAKGATPPTNDALDAALPTFTIQIDDGAGGSSDVPLKATSSYLEPITKDGITYYCPEIETRNVGGSTVLGSAFMREQVVIFDLAASRIGFAPYASCATR
ncbi:MAG: pepsin-like aspartic protease [Polyangiaceae bacterium]